TPAEEPAQQVAAPEPITQPPQQYYYPSEQPPQTANFTQYAGGDTMAGSNQQMDEFDENYDPFDKRQVTQLVAQAVEAALRPSRQQMHGDELNRQFNSTFERFGSDENFKAVMQTALERCLAHEKSGRGYSIEREFEKASEEASNQR